MALGKHTIKPKIITESSENENYTLERLFLTEMWNRAEDPSVSIAKAKVKPGVTTALHYLDGVDEKYIIISGKGIMEIEGLPLAEVSPGDVVVIPANSTQRITNVGQRDMIFYCICTPRFTNTCYHAVIED